MQLDPQENRAGQRHLIDHPAVIQLLANTALVKLISATLGCNAFAYKATQFDKRTDANWLVAWHRDILIPVANRCELPKIFAARRRRVLHLESAAPELANGLCWHRQVKL